MNENFEVTKHFDLERSNGYEQKIRCVVPGYEAMHEMAHSLLKTHLPEQASVLVVGAGTGQEVISYALANPGWKVTGVDPTESMLTMARQQVDERKLAERVQLHLGYLDSLESSSPFEAATSILVMQFLADDGSKESYLRSIASRLKSQARLILVDLEGEKGTDEFEVFAASWKSQQLGTRTDRADVEKDFDHILRDIQFVPQRRIEELLTVCGFVKVRKFYQAFLLGGYVAEKA